ncbi:MAG TPA: TIR domain-containing protein, partial [Polyangiaceae bacterium]
MSVSGENPAKVFISYSRADAGFADRLAQDLERLQIPIWIDRRIQPGSRWDQEVQEAIKRATAMIVILSKRSVASLAVGDEFTYALDDGDLVVPVVYEVCEVPLRLARLQRVDFTTGYDDALRQLAVRLRQHTSTLPPHTISAELSDAPPGAGSFGAPRSRLPLAAGVGVALTALLGFGFALLRTPAASGKLPLALPSAATSASAAESAHVAPSASALPAATVDARSLQAALRGEQMLLQYRSSGDERSQLIASKDSWLAAAESFDAAYALGTAPKPQLAHFHSAGQFARGMSDLLQGRLVPAQQAFFDAIVSDGTWAAPDIALADVLARHGRFDEAHQHARHAQQLEPDFWLGAIAAGGVYAAQGDMNDAIVVYQAAAARFDIALIKADLALAYHAARAHDALAVQLAGEALKRDPNLTPALTVVAEQALEAKTFGVARGYTQRLVDNDVFSVTAWLLHGDALLALGERPLARQAYQRAVDLFAQTHQLGAPAQHLADVTAALEAGRLPADRFASEAHPARPFPAANGVERPVPATPALPLRG